MSPLEQITGRCRDLGLELIGVAPVPQGEGASGEGWFTPHVARLKEWVERGAHAEMEWMTTQLDKRVDPQLLLPGARSALVLWLGHHFTPPPRPDILTGRVARYAWGRDYHNVLRRALRQLGKLVQSLEPQARNHGAVDTSPVLERAFAERAHVGWIGRSTMLIHPRRGSYGSLAVLLTTLELPSAAEAHPERCGTCEDCVTLCPTGALSSDGLDARRCISYWTIEHRGVIPRELRPMIGAWVFGCDICQEVCPWNRRAPYEGPAARALWEPQAARAWPDLTRWLEMSDEELNQSLLGSPLRRAFPWGLKRNALISLANQGELKAIPLVEAQLSHPDLGVQTAAIWALVTLTRRAGRGLDELKGRLFKRLSEGPHSPELQEELLWAYSALST